jgi:hypothetical protein
VFAVSLDLSNELAGIKMAMSEIEDGRKGGAAGAAAEIYHHPVERNPFHGKGGREGETARPR